MFHNTQFVFTAALTLLLIGCVSTQPDESIHCVETVAEKMKSQLPRCGLSDHLMRFDNEGMVISQQSAYMNFIQRAQADALSVSEVSGIVPNMLDRAEGLGREHQDPNSKKVPVKLLLYVHGGLNSMHDTDKRIIEQKLPNLIVNAEGNDWNYPIFISWPSAMPPAWAEHTFRIREGRKAGIFTGLMTSPFILASDLFRTIGSYPATAYYQFTNDLAYGISVFEGEKGLPKPWGVANRNAERIREINSDSQPSELKVTTNIGSFDIPELNKMAKGSQMMLTAPLRYTYTSIYHSGIAASSWDNMQRRAQNIFAPERSFNTTFDNPYDEENFVEAQGSFFFETLLLQIIERQRVDPTLDYQITLVGHSMGTIVINLALNAMRDSWLQTQALRNIVYMAAAATIEDSINALEPVLESTVPVVPVRFFNLTLHRVAEVSEMNAFGLLPSGSLLVSIDQHYETPEHPLRRTMGSEVNVLNAAGEINARLEQSRAKIVLKTFDYEENCKVPTKHTHFGQIPFWQESTWQIDATSTSNNEGKDLGNCFAAPVEWKVDKTEAN